MKSLELDGKLSIQFCEDGPPPGGPAPGAPAPPPGGPPPPPAPGQADDPPAPERWVQQETLDAVHDLLDRRRRGKVGGRV